MFHLQGKIRDYTPSTDLASVDFEGLGSIEAWYDGLKVDPAISRGFLVHGAAVTIQAPDQHRLCEGIVVGVGDAYTTTTTGNTNTTPQAGRGFIATDNNGTGSASVSFNPFYSTTPSLQAAADNHYHLVISGLSTSGFTVSISGAPINSYVYFSWMSG